MNVIFLDFDGVLNSATSFLYEDNRRKKHKEQGIKGPVNETLSLHCCAAFQYVLDHFPEVRVVISSTWRNLYDFGWLQAKLIEYHIDGSRVIGVTPEDRMTGNRGAEIAWWLKNHPEVDHYVIIDDNNWGIVEYHGEGRFVGTDWERGMGVNHAVELIKKLGSANRKKMKEWDAERLAEAESLKEEMRKNPPKKMDDDF